MTTPNQGYYQMPTTGPDYQAGNSVLAQLSANFAILDAQKAEQVASASGAITITSGTVPITKAGVAAITLAVPVAGLPSAGGNDGQELTVIDTTGHAHTVTTPASGINGSLHVATFGGTVGQFVSLRAYNGVWYVLASNGVTLS